MKTVLVKVAYLIEVEDELYQETTITLGDGSQAITYKDTPELESFEDAINKSVPPQLILNEKYTAQWQSTEYKTLEPNYENCGQCNHCGAWTTDCEKEAPIEELASGATVDGKLYCELCLPKDHPLTF